MIFIVLGTQKFQLNRLLKEVDDSIEQGRITQDVIAQIGTSDYEPKHYQYYRYMDKEQFDEYISEARVIITHSGVGSIVTALKLNKPVVVYPRLKKYKEHVDNHQLDIAKAFGKKHYVLCCYDDETLQDVLKRCMHYPFQRYTSNTNKIIGIVEDFLE